MRLLDLHFALRLVRRQPLLAAALTLVLSGGIAVTTAVFGLVNAVWFEPLAYPHAERLAVVRQSHPRLGDAELVSPRTYETWSAATGWNDGHGAFAERTFALGRPGAHAERARGAALTPSLLHLLGARPVIGRLLAPGDAVGNAPPVVIVSERFWRRHLQGSPDTVGSRLKIDGREATVVGVLPYAFRMFNSGFDLFVPLQPVSSDQAPSLTVVARVPEGAVMEAAARRLSALTAAAGQGRSVEETAWTPVFIPLDAVLRGDARAAYLLLLTAAGLLLALITANVANLLLAHSEARRLEFAVRLALGSGRRGVIRQLSTEGLLLSLSAGTLAFLLCSWLHRLLISRVPEMTDLRIDARVFLFTFGLSLGAGLVFGALPAWSLLRRESPGLLHGHTVTQGPRRRMGRVLAAAQVAAAAALMICCGLLVRGAFATRGIDPGFSTDRLLTASLSLPSATYGDETRRAAFFRDLLQRAAAMPGVQQAGLTTVLPLDGGVRRIRFDAEGRPGRADESRQASLKVVSPGYFRAIGLPLVTGEAMREGPRDEAVVSRGLARALWGSEAAAVGRRLRADDGAWFTVVGVVAEARQILTEPAVPELYLPMAAAPPHEASIVLRTSGDPLAVAPALSELVRAMDVDLPLDRAWSMTMIVGSYFPAPLVAVFGLLSCVSLGLSAVGLYAVVAFQVTRRSKEFGIRMALGAKAGAVLRMVVAEGLRLTAAGLAVGLLAGLGLGRLLAHRFAEVSLADPLPAILVSTVFAVVSMAACLLPGRRATRVSPSVALRQL